MKKEIDCLIIGHNNMPLVEYEKDVQKMGVNSGAYRDLNLNFIRFNNKPLHLSDFFNRFCGGYFRGKESFKSLNMFDTFSATIAYLGTYLNRRGFTFDYVLSFQDEKQTLAEKLEKENIRTIAITTTYYVSVLPILEIVAFIKNHNRSAKIIVGGPFVSTKVRCLNDPLLIGHLFESSIGADFYVNSSQGETALVEIINALNNNLSFAGIDNIYYKVDGGRGYAATPVKPENNRLSENMVDWDLFVHNVGEYADLRTSISCPFSCAFCGFPEHAGKYQTTDVDAIEQELKRLDKITSLKGVKFIDDTFNVPPTRYKNILRMMIRNKYKFKWIGNFRCQFADREMVELMKESGCEAVYLGIESGSDEILKNMNKQVTVDDYLRGIALLKEYDIMTFGSFIVGFPGETDETVRETIQFIEKSGIEFFRANLWYCEHITPIWKKREKYQIKGDGFEWSHGTMDSKRAADLVEQLFLTIKNPIWVPIYNFEMDSLWHLLHRGMTIDRVKKLLIAFNDGIKEKLKAPSIREVPFDIIKQVKECCRVGEGAVDFEYDQSEGQDRYRVEFDLD